MTDRDDALRRELGWTGPEEEDFEPDTGPSGPRVPPPIPPRPPVQGPAAAARAAPPQPVPGRGASFRDTQQMRPG
ncbi:MinD/ParA family ATP-binding protein, partial [Mycolicibacterium litorale]